MAMSSLYKIAEQAKYQLRAGDIQPILASVIDCYSTAAKREWYENKNDGYSSLDGGFLYTYGIDGDLEPILDLALDMYYIVLPSSYLRLPGEYGINYVGYIKGQTSPFVRINAGSVGIWNNLKANVFPNTYYTEGSRIYFPKITNLTNAPIMLKLAIALDNVDVDEELNIPRSVIDNVVNMVVAKFSPVKPIPEKVNI